MADTESANSDPIRKEPLRVDIENDISDVSCAANTLYHLLEGIMGTTGIQRVSAEDANSLFWCAAMLVKAANQLSEKYHGEAKEAANG